ncbi:ATP-binding protein [Notoacmeibacter marinus]|uniref:ATP-binding protein n=1 Tax=Notoacmeibacter marinus TaxID=1876515 RepID=UPI000DF12044|nr:ATP-binding protein [Notoacmeibacter marinus]
MGAASLAAAIFILFGLTFYLLLRDELTYDEFIMDETVSDVGGPEVAIDKRPDSPSADPPQEETDSWADLLAIILFAFGGSAIGGLVGYRFARRISRPIEALASTARNLSAGDLSARAEFKGRQTLEIEKLVHDFNFMAAELERAQREQADSASAIAHELRTPVTVLRGRLQGLSDGVFELDERTLNGLIAQTETLSRIIDDLRTLTLARNGRLELWPIRTDLSQEAKIVMEAVQPLVEEAGLAVHSNLEPAPAIADPERVRQAIGALVENAQRYASDGGDLTIESGTAGGTAFVRVMDRGAGLNRKEVARIFDRFWRADPSRSRAFGGSGLGLAVVRSISRGHGGEATYADRPGGGAIFEIALPAEEER